MSNTRRALPLILIVLIAFGSLAVVLAKGWAPALGLDLQGGVSVVFVAVEADGALWVASSSLTSLARYDPATTRVDRVDVGTTSRGLVARFGRLWTSPGAAAD